jgi:hypothetical protein
MGWPCSSDWGSNKRIQTFSGKTSQRAGTWKTKKFGVQLNIKINLRKIGCKDMNWVEKTTDNVQLWASVLVVLNLQLLSPEW